MGSDPTGMHTLQIQRTLFMVKEAGETVSEEDRLGDHFQHNANHSTAHKWLVVNWRTAFAKASDNTVLMGDKGKGKAAYAEWNDCYIPDVVSIGEDETTLGEIKNYSAIVKPSTNAPACTSLNGHVFAFGNTEERLKYKVLGSRRRGRVVDGPFNHRDGSGYVKANYGDYGDAIRNRKAKVLLLGHENSGGMSAFAAKQLYRLGREAKEHGNDSTDYQRSHTARSFVPFYAQRMCTAIVMHGAKGILKGLKIARAARLRRAGTASDSDCPAVGSARVFDARA